MYRKPFIWTTVLIALLSVSCCNNSDKKEVAMANEEESTAVQNENKILIAFYSWSGNTKEIALQIQAITGGDIFEIQPQKDYSQDHKECVEQARKEIQSGYKPELTKKVENIDNYDIIFVGTPNWCGTLAPPVGTFLTSYNFSQKNIVPFCTHGTGGVQNVFDDMAKLLPNANILNGFATYGKDVQTSKQNVEEWVKNTINKK
ncbi:MAG: flavodoxin [Bacteroidales bacterium]|jgi:flavodoxin|nr:flavodoxin [Bacteroidales bacterium]